MSKIIHNKTNTKEFKIWYGMKRRCYDIKHKSYKYYGAKGITVCPEWINSFEKFLEDMGKVTEGYSLDRIDGTKGYYKENCRWATIKQQNDNRKNASDFRYLELYDIKLHVAEWARILEIKSKILHNRLASGWTDEKILTTPIKRKTLFF